MNKKLYETLGFIKSKPNWYTQAQQGAANAPDSQSPSHYDTYKGIKVSYCSSLESYQKRILAALEKHGQDVYVQAPPGAGKTGPMICYFAKHHLKLNPELDPTNDTDTINFFENLNKIVYAPQDIDKMLILVPVIKLAREFYRDFTAIFSSVICQYITLIITNCKQMYSITRDNSVLEILSEILNLKQQIIYLQQTDPSDPDIVKFRNQINSYYIGYNDLITNGKIAKIEERYLNKLYYTIGGKDLISILDERSKLYNYFNNNIKDLNNINVVNDFLNRLHQFDNDITKLFNESLQKYIEENLVAMYTGPDTRAKTSAPMIVSVYALGANILIKLGNDKTKIKLVVCDEAHLLQELYESEGDDDEEYDDSKDIGMTQADQLSYNLYYILKQLPDTKLLLMTGTAHPESVADLVDFLNFCYNRKIKIEANIPTSNAASIGFIPADWLRNDNEIIEKLLVNPRSTNNLLILFGKQKTLDLINKAIKRKGGGGMNIANIDKGNYDNKPTIGSSSFSKIFAQQSINNYNGKYPVPNKDFGNMKRSDPASTITYPLQKMAVQYGLGFICRMTDNMPDYDERLNKEYEKDFDIVQDLFKRGIVKTIIATDAVGIGVNVDVKNMYIPTTQKFEGVTKGMQELKVSNFAQLLARVGRRAFASATIYAPEESIPLIAKALAASPSGSDFEKRRTIGKSTMSMAMCQSKKWFTLIMNKIHTP